MTNIDLNQQVEIEFWRNAEGESPESNSLQNIINKLIDANTLVDCFEKYRVNSAKTDASWSSAVANAGDRASTSDSIPTPM